MISGNKKNNVSRLRYTHLLSNALPFNSLIRIIICDRSSSLKQVLHSFHFVFHDIKMHFYITLLYKTPNSTLSLVKKSIFFT